MTQTITVNTARPNLALSLVAGLSQPYTPKAFPRLVYGETVDVSLYLVDGGAYDTRSGVAGSTPRISITLDDSRSTAGTFTISDGTVTTTALPYDATESEVEAALNALNTNTGPNGDKVLVTKFNSGAFSILYDTVGAKGAFTVNASGIQPLSAATITELVAGSATVREEQLIQLKAEPLVFTSGGTEITNGWTISLAATNPNLLRALSLEQGPISANYSIEIVNSSSHVDVVAKGPVILSPSVPNSIT